MALLNLSYGQENLANGMTSVYVFHSEIGGQERHVWEAAKRHPSIIRTHGSSNVRGALKRPIGQDPGKWTTQAWEIADGTILKVFATQDKGIFGAGKTTASQYIRVRATAPLWKIRVKLLDRVETNVPHLDITGRFDLLSATDVKQAGIAIHPAFAKQLLEIEHTKMFEKTVLEQSTVARDIVVERKIVVAGEVATVTRQEARRSLQF